MARALSPTEIDSFEHIPREVAERVRFVTTKLLPPRADAMTVGRFILVRPGHEESRTLMAHELVHARQWAEWGRFGFLRRYLGDYLVNLARLRSHRKAYLAIPFETEARNGAKAWAGGPRAADNDD